MEDNHFSQDQIKGHMQLKDSDLLQCTSRTSRLSTVESAISSTTFPTTTIEIATSRKLSISGGPNEATCNQQSGVPAICELQQHAVSAKYDRHHPRPQNVNRIVSQHYEPFTVSRIQQPSFLNNSKSERERNFRDQLNAYSQSQQGKTIPLPFPTRTTSARKLESDEELLKMFRKVEINIPLLDAIKQIPK
ncbi:hypothetical protein CR513_11034, partial [Mucuna pruriens]